MSVCDAAGCLIRHCSPTLAGMKTAGLFTYYFEDELQVNNFLYSCNRLLNPKGVYAYILRKRQQSALVLVYRPSLLCDDLKKSGVREFLATCGYDAGDIEGCMATLRQRMESNSQFPHEIGLFLGYPLCDVLGFISHGGKNSKCSGPWKVYGDKEKMQKLFAKYSKCREVYARQFLQGKPIERLIVAA